MHLSFTEITELTYSIATTEVRDIRWELWKEKCRKENVLCQETERKRKKKPTILTHQQHPALDDGDKHNFRLQSSWGAPECPMSPSPYGMSKSDTDSSQKRSVCYQHQNAVDTFCFATILVQMFLALQDLLIKWKIDLHLALAGCSFQTLALQCPHYKGGPESQLFAFLAPPW